MNVKQNLSRRSIWMRLLYMLLFVIFYTVAELVIAAVVIFQFFLSLITGRANERLLFFGKGLSIYVYQVMRYLTFNGDTKPFPFEDWPEASHRNSQAQMANAEESWTTKSMGK